MTRQSVIAYWLIPSEPAYSWFQRIINNLARRCAAPVFEPHLTVHVGASQADAAEAALAQVASQCKFIGLTPLGIDQSAEFIKTLFVQFAVSPDLWQTRDIIRRAANDTLDYELKPHLSLLYKTLASATRQELAASIAVPFCEITFDAIKAVRCVSPTQTRLDVEAWRVLATQKLSPRP